MESFEKSYQDLSQGIVVTDNNSLSIGKNNVSSESSLKKITKILHPSNYLFGIIIFLVVFLSLFFIKPSFVITNDDNSKDIKVKDDKSDVKKRLNMRRVLFISILSTLPYYVWYYMKYNKQ